jgi:hypothetical protein
MKPYYYALIHSPGDKAIRHDTLAEAQAEAVRMAGDGRGLSIEILRCVGIASCSKASTFWMDGEGLEPVKHQAEPIRYFISRTGHTAWRKLPDGGFEVTSPVCDGWGKSIYKDEKNLADDLIGIREITAAELPEGIEP